MGQIDGSEDEVSRPWSRRYTLSRRQFTIKSDWARNRQDICSMIGDWRVQQTYQPNCELDRWTTKEIHAELEKRWAVELCELSWRRMVWATEGMAAFVNIDIIVYGREYSLVNWRKCQVLMFSLHHIVSFQLTQNFARSFTQQCCTINQSRHFASKCI